MIEDARIVGRIKASWDDMSPYVVHFTKAGSSRDAANNSMSIASSCMLMASKRYGIGKNYKASPKSVCFSEAPLHQLRRIARSRFGIGFRKEYIVKNGGGPILYAYKGTPHAGALLAAIQENINDPNHPIWTIAPFVDTPGIFENKKYLFEYEREWRVSQDLKFGPDDVSFLILPEEYHAPARDFFEDAEANNLGPNFKCPFIDAWWKIDKIEGALAAAAESF